MRARRAGDAAARHLPRMQLLFDGSEELERTAGLGLIAGEVTRAAGRRPAGPAHRLERGPFERASPLTADLPRAGCPFYHVHSYAARPADARRRGRRPPSTASGSPRWSPWLGVRRPVPPREVLAARAAHARRFVAVVRGPGRRCAHDPAAGDRHPRGQGGAPDPRASSTSERLRRRSARRRAALGRGGRARDCTSSISTARAPALRSTSSTPADRRARSTCRSRSAAGCARSRRSRRRVAPAPRAS